MSRLERSSKGYIYTLPAHIPTYHARTHHPETIQPSDSPLYPSYLTRPLPPWVVFLLPFHTMFAHSLAHEVCSTTLQTPQAYPTIPTLETQQTEVAKHDQTTARVVIAEPKPVATAQFYFHVSNGQGGSSDRSGTWGGRGWAHFSS